MARKRRTCAIWPNNSNPGLSRNFARSKSSIPHNGSQCLHGWTSPTPPEDYKHVHYAAERQCPRSIGDCERRVHEHIDWKQHRAVLQIDNSPLEEGYRANLLHEEELDQEFLTWKKT